jgi:uncharacterized membrane protein YfcA
MDHITLLIVLGAACAGFVQGLSGFAFGMIAMSFWVWVLNPQMAAVMTIFGSLVGQFISVFTVRREIKWRLILPFLLGGVAGIPLGIMALPLLDIHQFKFCLGLMLVTWCPIMLLANRLPRIEVQGKVRTARVGAVGGVMAGIGGFSGVVPSLWCSLSKLDKDTQRSIIQNFNISILSVTMAIYLSRGMVSKDMLPLFFMIAPAIVIPALLGSRVYVGMSDARFRQVILSLLTVSGVSMLISALT